MMAEAYRLLSLTPVKYKLFMLHSFRRESTTTAYDRVVSSFPQGSLQMAFAYGSGVFQQEGHSNKNKNMLDFILVVDDPIQWHEANLKKHYRHYSFLRVFGSKGISKFQEVGAGVYFNTLIPWEDRFIKYGVVSTSRAKSDLLNWSELYVSGRLHKPVLLVRAPTDTTLRDAIETNYDQALNFACLLLPEKFSEFDLYETITGMSYTGDPRMVIGEDKNKVKNIVKPNVKHFHDIYNTRLSQDKHIRLNTSSREYEQDINDHVTRERFKKLPKCIMEAVEAKVGDKWKEMGRTELATLASEAVHRVVFSSSTRQTAISVFMGGSRSFKYSVQKLKKWLKSLTG